MKSIIEAIVDYVAGCPLLEDGRLNLDYLGGGGAAEPGLSGGGPH